MTGHWPRVGFILAKILTLLLQVPNCVKGSGAMNHKWEFHILDKILYYMLKGESPKATSGWGDLWEGTCLLTMRQELRTTLKDVMITVE